MNGKQQRKIYLSFVDVWIIQEWVPRKEDNWADTIIKSLEGDD